MREILFRAWDPLRNKMWKYAVPMFEGKINVSDRENGTFNEIIKGELMQWTGLVDCKGNKIYENDIICFNDVGADSDGIRKIVSGEVVFEDGCFYAKECSDMLTQLALCYDLEVIGNRFQNPELIKE